MKRFLPIAIFAIVAVVNPVRADDLPADAVKLLKQHEETRNAIRAKADADLASALSKLVKELTEYKDALEKDGKVAEAKAVSERISQLGRDGERTSNLLVNGSFEEGTEPSGMGFNTLVADSTDMRGWKITAGSIDHIGPFWKATHGTRSLDLNGSEVGAISQAFKTTVGQKYSVSFALSANPDSAAASKKVKVGAAGKSEEFTFEKKDANKENMGWVIRTWEFTAVAEETTLEFVSLSVDEPAVGPALDDVIVVPAKK
jgi:choice-of-anchor C domain-containing protein